jgi:hypothetical protein
MPTVPFLINIVQNPQKSRCRDPPFKNIRDIFDLLVIA